MSSYVIEGALAFEVVLPNTTARALEAFQTRTFKKLVAASLKRSLELKDNGRSKKEREDPTAATGYEALNITHAIVLPLSVSSSS